MLSSVTRNTGRFTASRGKSPTSQENGFIRYAMKSARKGAPYPLFQLNSRSPDVLPCIRSQRCAWYGTNWLPRSFTARERAPNGYVPWIARARQ